MKLPAYPRYKPSSVEWLGDVPEHWGVRRLKYLTEISTSGVWGEDPDSENDGCPVATTANISPQGEIDVPGMHRRLLSKEELRKGLCRPGDTVVVKSSGSASSVISGKCAMVRPEHGDICFSNFTLRVRPIEGRLDPFFAWSFLSSGIVRAQVRLMVSTTTYPNLQVPEYISFLVPQPPPAEQQAIATFLDRETGRVDRLVAKKRELIERLKEKRIALISRTVTRGLPAEAAAEAGLPENPPLKPSGLDWLGDIPEHWEVRKFSREVAIAEGQVDPEKEPYASMLLIGPEHVESGTGRLLQRSTAADQAAESGKYFSRKGDVIYSKIRPALRKLVIAPEDCLCSADMYPLRARQRLNNRFIAWFFLSEQFSGWSVLESDRVAMPKINRDTLNELRMPIPPLPEQTAIAGYLDQETAKLNALVTKVEEAIERLQEYRTALITAAVTGKIDVRSRHR